jgi:hypothetical protein
MQMSDTQKTRQENLAKLGLGGAAAVGTVAITTVPAFAQAADPVGDVTDTATALNGIVGIGLTIGIALLAFGIGSKILRKMSRG